MNAIPDRSRCGKNRTAGSTRFQKQPLDDRFNGLFVPVTETGCHLWIGARLDTGYGVMMIERKLVGAHRISWLLNFGQIPPGKVICHKCDTPSCVNPHHLFLGTAGDNARDRNRKGRDQWGGTKKQVFRVIDANLRPRYVRATTASQAIRHVYHIVSRALNGAQIAALLRKNPTGLEIVEEVK